MSNQEPSKKKKFLKKMLLGAMLVPIFLSAGAQISVNAEETKDSTFYRQASLLAHEFSKQQTPTDSETRAKKTDFLVKNGTSVRTGQGGNLLGYPDKDDGEGGKWISSVISVNTEQYSLDQLTNLYSTSNEADGSTTVNALRYYAQFGYTLNDTGFDKTVTSGMSMVFRKISGGLLYLAYMMANIGPMLMGSAIKLIRLVNPFLLINSITGIVDDAAMPAVIRLTAEFVGNTFSSIRGFSLAVLMPVTIGFTAFNILVFRKGKAGKSIARLFLKVFMLIAGVSLVGATYTSILEKLDDMSDSGVGYTDYMIISSLVDFESWSLNTRLALPSNFDLDKAFIASTDSGETLTEINGNPRMVVARINAVANNDSGLLVLANSLEDGWGGMFEKGLSNLGSGNPDSDALAGVDSGSYRKYSYSLLSRYFKGSLISGSDYEGLAKGYIKDDDEAYKMVTGLATLLKKSNATFDDFDKEDSFGYAKNIFNAGSLVRGDAVTMTSGRSGKYFKTNKNYTLTGTKIVPPMGASADQGGLTPLSMYNYLNSAFSNTGVIVYSPERSNALETMVRHASVNFVGGTDGISNFAGYIETFIILTAVACISGVFAWSLFSVTFLSIYRILPGIFGSMTGSIQGITKLLIVTVALLTEIIGSVFMYGVINHLYLSIMFGLDDLIYIDGLAGWAQGTLVFVKSLVAILMSVLLIVMVAKHSRKFTKAMDEMATATIQKLMGTLDHQMNQDNPFGPGLDQQALDDHRKRAVDGVTGNSPGGSEQAKQMALEEIQAENTRRKKSGERGLTSAERQRIKGRHEMGMAIARGKDMALGLVGIDSSAVDSEMKMHEARMRGSEDYLRGQSEIDYSAASFNENDFLSDNDVDSGDDVEQRLVSKSQQDEMAHVHGSPIELGANNDDAGGVSDATRRNNKEQPSQDDGSVGRVKGKVTPQQRNDDDALGQRNRTKPSNVDSLSDVNDKNRSNELGDIDDIGDEINAREGLSAQVDPIDKNKGIRNKNGRAETKVSVTAVDENTKNGNPVDNLKNKDARGQAVMSQQTTPSSIRATGQPSDVSAKGSVPSGPDLAVKRGAHSMVQTDSAPMDETLDDNRFYEDIVVTATRPTSENTELESAESIVTKQSLAKTIGAGIGHVANAPVRSAAGRLAGYKEAIDANTNTQRMAARRVERGQQKALTKNARAEQRRNSSDNKLSDNQSSTINHIGTGSIVVANPVRLVSQNNVKSEPGTLTPNHQPRTVQSVYADVETLSSMGVASTSSYSKELIKTIRSQKAYQDDIQRLRSANTSKLTDGSLNEHNKKLAQAQAKHQKANQKVAQLKNLAPALIHIDGLSFDGLSGGRFKGDAPYVMTSLNTLDSLLKQRASLDKSPTATTVAGRLHRQGLDQDIKVLQKSLERQGFSERMLTTNKGVRHLNASMKQAYDSFLEGGRKKQV